MAKSVLRLGIVLGAILAVSTVTALARSDRSPAASPAAQLGTVTRYLPLVLGESRPVSPGSPTPRPTSGSPAPTATSIPAPTDQLIADHRVLSQFDEIPDSAIRSAAEIDTLFMHQSTGNNIEFLGLRCLAGLQDGLEDPEGAECAGYTDGLYDHLSNWEWPEWDTPMADAPGKADEWVNVAESRQAEFSVLGMKFCYVDGYNQDFDYYREKMEALEAAHPGKIFIWSTSALWSKDELINNPNNQVSFDSIQEFNRRLREYALENDKYLYDIAAIESHDPSGAPCQYQGYEVLCDEYYDGFGGGGGGHPDILGSIRLAKGFWWLMARISGWEG